MQPVFALSSAGGPSAVALLEFQAQLMAWILFGISVLTTVGFLLLSWYFSHKLRIVFPLVALLILHPGLWSLAWPLGIDVLPGSWLVSTAIAIYAAVGSIILYKRYKQKFASSESDTNFEYQ